MGGRSFCTWIIFFFLVGWFCFWFFRTWSRFSLSQLLFPLLTIFILRTNPIAGLRVWLPIQEISLNTHTCACTHTRTQTLAWMPGAGSLFFPAKLAPWCFFFPPQGLIGVRMSTLTSLFLSLLFLPSPAKTQWCWASWQQPKRKMTCLQWKVGKRGGARAVNSQ